MPIAPNLDEVAPRSRPRASPYEVELSSRLAAAPADAELRGILFQMVDDALRVDPVASARYAAAFPVRRRSYAMYPLRDYLQRLDFAATALGPSTREGLTRLHQRAAAFALASPTARLLLRTRDLDPFRMIERLERSRSMFGTYGSWRVHGRRGDVSIVVRDEYVWLDAAWVPAIASVFPACGLATLADIECELDGPYSGRIRVRW